MALVAQDQVKAQETLNMRTFQDTAGKTWTLSLNIVTAKKIRDALAVDFFDDDIGETVGKIASNPILLADVLWVCVEEQANKEGVSDEDFGRALGGDVISHATDSFLDELVDFYPEKKRQLLSTMLQKLRTTEAAYIEKAMSMMTSEVMDNVIQQELAKLDNLKALASGSKSG